MMNTKTKIFLFAALALFAAKPTLAQGTQCIPQQGSLSDDGVFTPGTADTDTDYRVTTDYSETTSVLRWEGLVGSSECRGLDPTSLDKVYDTPDARIVHDMRINRGIAMVDVQNSIPPGALTSFYLPSLAIIGDVRVAAGRSDHGIFFSVRKHPNRRADPNLSHDLFVDSWANVHVDGGGWGFSIRSEDRDTDHAVRARNFGAIVTEGAPVNNETWLQTGRGVYVRSDGGDAEASNEAGATVTTRGQGAAGVVARAPFTAGTATAVNRGAIDTYGDMVYLREQEDEYRSDGLSAYSAYGPARAVNEAGAEIRTGGVSAWGMRADGSSAEASNSGAISTTGAGSWGMRVRATGSSPSSSPATGTNAGSIVTRGEPWLHPAGYTRYAHGVWVYTPSGAAAATNAAGGAIDAHGAGASGMGVRSDSGAASGTNAGSIVTRGHSHVESDGDRSRPNAMAITSGSGDASATNAAGGEIETHGRLARGMLAFSSGSGAAAAVNAGAIVTRSSFSIARSELSPDVRSEWADDRAGATGITAWSRSGAAAVTHTGSVTVAGDSAGIYAGIGGSGTASVTVTGGRVAAGGSGVWIEAMEGTAEAAFSDGARVEAPTALLIRAGSSNVTVEDSTIRGRMVFSDGASGYHLLTISDDVIMDGPIVFGPEPADDPPSPPSWWDSACAPDEPCVVIDKADVIPMSVSDISGVGTLIKRRPGTARLQDVAFSGSRMILEGGRLELRGSVDLGSEGTVTVHDGARLTVLVGDVTENADDHGSIVAGGGVTFRQQEEAGEPTIGILVAPEAAGKAAAIQTALEEGAVQPIRARIMKRVGDGEPTPTAATASTETTEGGEKRTTEIGSFTAAGTVAVSVPENGRIGVAARIEEPEAAGGGGGGGGGGDSGPAIAIGGGALLAFIFGSGLFDDAGAEEAALDDCADAPRTGGWCTSLSLAGPGAPATVEERARLGGLETWTRLVGTDTAVPAAAIAGATAESLSIGMDARLPGGFRLGVAATPEMTASKPWRPGVASGAALGGERFALRAGWRDGPLFADAELSRGRYESSATLDNPAVGGALSGTFDLVQQQARATAGARIDLGRARLTPALTPFAGTLRQDAWTAASAALTTDVPGVSRRYSGVKAGLGVTSTGWLPGPGGLRWRPSLRFSTVSVETDGPSSLAMRQSDRAGVLSFASRGVMAGLPRRIHGLAAAATAAGSGAWRLRLGYAGMEVDGEVEHGAGLRLQARF